MSTYYDEPDPDNPNRFTHKPILPSEDAKRQYAEEMAEVDRRMTKDTAAGKDWGPRPSEGSIWDAPQGDSGDRPTETTPTGAEYSPATETGGVKKFSNDPMKAGDKSVGYIKEKPPAKAPFGDQMDEFSPESKEKFYRFLIADQYDDVDYRTASIFKMTNDSAGPRSQDPEAWDKKLASLKKVKSEQLAMLDDAQIRMDRKQAAAAAKAKIKQESEKASSKKALDASKAYDDIQKEVISLHGQFAEASNKIQMFAEGSDGYKNIIGHIDTIRERIGYLKGQGSRLAKDFGFKPVEVQPDQKQDLTKYKTLKELTAAYRKGEVSKSPELQKVMVALASREQKAVKPIVKPKAVKPTEKPVGKAAIQPKPAQAEKYPKPPEKKEPYGPLTGSQKEIKKSVTNIKKFLVDMGGFTYDELVGKPIAQLKKMHSATVEANKKNPKYGLAKSGKK